MPTVLSVTMYNTHTNDLEHIHGLYLPNIRAIGATRLARKQAIVAHLPVVEELAGIPLFYLFFSLRFFRFLF